MALFTFSYSERDKKSERNPLESYIADAIIVPGNEKAPKGYIFGNWLIGRDRTDRVVYKVSDVLVEALANSVFSGYDTSALVYHHRVDGTGYWEWGSVAPDSTSGFTYKTLAGDMDKAVFDKFIDDLIANHTVEEAS